jgi:hypothetical protein
MNEVTRQYLRFATVSFIVAIPFVFVAALSAASDDKGGLLFLGGYIIFMLGVPLTKLPELLGYGPIFGPGSWWVVMESLLFVIQWIILSQLIVIIWRRIMRRRGLS